MQRISAVGVVLFTLSVVLAFHEEISITQAQPSDAGRGDEEGQDAEPPSIYTGTTPCAFSDCHGSVTPTEASERPIDQNEYYTWLKKDRHAKAYEVLLKERSIQIIKNLKITDNAEQHTRCLNCHALNIPPEQRGKYFEIAEGVSCESCHGPSKKWLGPHRRLGEGYDAALTLGMYDTRNLRKRAEKCLSCHLGDADRSVDHALIAAGHPDLLFELDTFSALMPPHWRTDQADQADQESQAVQDVQKPEPQKIEERWLGARQWAVGLAVGLREAAKRLARRAPAPAPAWPEFSEFDCFACHHALPVTASTYYTPGEEELLEPDTQWSPSWRQARGYTGLAGSPAWNAARYVVFRHVVGIIAPDTVTQLDQDLAAVAEQMQTMTSAQPDKIVAAASQLAQRVDQLIPQIAEADFSLALLSTLLKNIAADQAALATAGVRMAEQVVMALDALFRSHAADNGSGVANTAVQASIQQLFRTVENPRAYTPQAFTRQLQTVRDALAGL
jgi:hypothetical protein